MKTGKSAANPSGPRPSLDWQRHFPSKQLVLGLMVACSVITASDAAYAQTWALTDASTNSEWQALACSADGSILTAAAYDDGFGDGGPIYRSTNFGVAWTPSAAPTNYAWQSIACSTNGVKLVAAINQDENENPGPI